MSSYDTGVAAERTRLSRHRTSLTVVTCALTVLHLTLARVGVPQPLYPTVLALAAIGAALHVFAVRTHHAPPAPALRSLGVAAAVSTVGVALLVMSLGT